MIILIVTLLPWLAFGRIAYAIFRLVRPWIRWILTVRPPIAIDEPLQP